MSTLPREELERFWAHGVPLEAEHVPEEDLARALRESRVKSASSYSSMGTAETYWGDVSTRAEMEIGRGCIVLPPGVTSCWPTIDESIDSRDVIDTLWSPFWRGQQEGVCAKVPKARLGELIAELARRLAFFEERRIDEGRRAHTPRDAALVELLREVGDGRPLDDKRLDELLADERGGNAALATRIRRVLRARSATAAVSVTVEAAKEDERRALRFELLRFALRLTS